MAWSILDFAQNCQTLGRLPPETATGLFSSKLEKLGVSKTVRRDLLGHEPGDMTDDYTW